MQAELPTEGVRATSLDEPSTNHSRVKQGLMEVVACVKRPGGDSCSALPASAQLQYGAAVDTLLFTNLHTYHNAQGSCSQAAMPSHGQHLKT